MTPIGNIEVKRLKSIPRKYHAAHEFCFHLHDIMVNLLVEMKRLKADAVSVQLNGQKDIDALSSGIHALDFLEQTGRLDIERRVMINHISGALYADMLHFIYEALIALEKRKFTVAYTLLRKPFKEGMVIAAQMCADEEAFFKLLKYDAKNILNRRRLDQKSMIELMGSAIGKCGATKYADAEFIYSVTFDRQNKNGLAQLFDKATHLVTEYTQIATEDYNINFIFKDPRDNDVYESTYSILALLLLFLNLMQIELYSRMSLSNDKYKSWLLFTSIGTYEALFVPGQAKITNFLNTSLKEFLICTQCAAQLRIKKADAAKFFVSESVICKACGLNQHFPLNWFLSKLDLDLSE